MNADQNIGLFVPSTYVWDVAQLQDANLTMPQLKELLIRLYQNINNITLSLNLKDSAVYDNTTEFVCGQTFFPDPAMSGTQATMRQSYRTVIDFGPLPNAGSSSKPHNIVFNNSYTFTRIYGTATDTTNLQAIPIPYVDAGLVTMAPPTLTPSPLGNIQIYVDATDVWITTTANLSNFDRCILVLEYLKY